MGSVFFIVLRRMRAPLIALIVIYAVAILGLVLIPGIDAAGQPAPPLSFFHAFYFISYTATTIGFGEIPGAFSDAQRLWVVVCIYLTVIGWSYSILSILAMFGDRGFQQALAASRFARRVRHLAEPFYLVCGCGETGGLLVHALDRIGLRFVVVEIDEARLIDLELDDFRSDAPTLVGDARQPRNLVAAGLSHPKCRGVLALTNDDEANLAVAVAVRLLNPDIPVLCRAQRPAVATRIAAFGADQIVNPFEIFGQLLGQAVHAPSSYLLHQWLTGTPGTRLRATDNPPRGRWIICGYGRFGRAVASHLMCEGLDLTLIDPNPCAEEALRVVVGSGIEEAALLEAGIMEAEGFVIGTDDDISNLSIAVLARSLNEKLYLVVRQNLHAHNELFDALDAEVTMVPSEIIAHECLAVLTTPLLSNFLTLTERESDDWAWALLSRLRMQLGNEVPQAWGIRLDVQNAAAVHRRLVIDNTPVRLATLLADPGERDVQLSCASLLLRRDGQDMLLPPGDTELVAGDEILFVGTHRARSRQELNLQNANVLDYLLLGHDQMGGWLWRQLARKGDSA